MITIDGGAVRSRRLALGMTTKHLASRCGVQSRVVAAVESGDQAGSAVTLRTLQRLADALAVPPLRLLTDPDENPTDPPTRPAAETPLAHEHPEGTNAASDAATLGTVLFDRPRNNPVGDLAAALGWSVARVQAGLSELEPRLAHVGARLHRDANRYRIVPADDTIATAATARLDHGRALRYGFTKEQTRMLARSFDQGVRARKMPPEHLRVLGRLLHVGYLVEDKASDRYRPGPTVIDAITPGGCPPSGQRTSTPAPVVTPAWRTAEQHRQALNTAT